MKQAICLMIIFAISVTSSVVGQISSNETLVLDQSVIASGGSVSGGQEFSVSGTAGQSIAGIWSSSAASQHHSGFWNGEPLGPTAAHVDLGGRVTRADGRPIRNARISLTESSGASRYAITNPFGYYTFSGIVAGQSVLISVTAKGFTFEKSTIVFNVSDSFDQLNFSAL